MKIEEAIDHALKNDWTYLQFGKWLTGNPCMLTPPEATTIMNLYRRQYPNAGRVAVDLETNCDKSLAISVRKTKKSRAATIVESVPAIPRPSIINRSAVKAFALKVSKEKRAGKFNRVSKEFLDSVEANLEALIREIAQGFSKQDKHAVAPDPESDWFINVRTLRCAEDKLNDAVKMIILAKVHGHPSIGKTLK